MKNYDASKTDGTPICCIRCDREIPGGNWFARFQVGDIHVAVCRPWCMEKFLEDRETYAKKVEPFTTKSAEWTSAAYSPPA